MAAYMSFNDILRPPFKSEITKPDEVERLKAELIELTYKQEVLYNTKQD